MKTYRVKGTTDEVTECELCGKPELKGTVMLASLDADGNEEGDVAYFGTSCAARAAGWTVKEVRAGVRRASDEERERQRVRRIEIGEAEQEFLTNWYQEHYGTPSLQKASEISGLSTVRTSDPAIKALRAAQNAGTVPSYY